MTSASYASPQDEPRRLAQAKVEEFTSKSVPLPSTLLIGNKLVSIADLLLPIKAFREQKFALQQVGKPWPCVRLFSSLERNPAEARWVPLDLAERGIDPSVPSGVAFEEIASGYAQYRAAARAKQAGFLVIEASPDELSHSFTEIVGGIVARRASSSVDQNGGPPGEPFTVTTDTSGLEVLVADGYFVSTQRGFGFSTPAKRILPWGYYSFGAKIAGQPKFSDTAWPVPDVTSIHLKM